MTDLKEGWAPVRFGPRPGSSAREPGHGPTVGLVSLGCPKNLVDSEVMLGRLRQSGYAIVNDPDDADVLVVNTCAFIESAKSESIDTILEMAQRKTGGRARRLVVTGCLSQRYDAELRKEIPEIDATLGTGQVDEIAAAVGGAATTADTASAPRWLYDHTTPRVLSTTSHLAYIKLSEGCDYNCSFCIIPKLRGRHRSRTEDDIVAEARDLAERGVRELILVSQDSTRYGLDLGRRDGLAPLLHRLGRVDGIRWIRVLYAYPATLSAPILDAMGDVDAVVKYVDIPLQHAAQSVLARMARPTGRHNLEGVVERIRERLPGAVIRTSFIVGFPGESDAEFEELVEFVRRSRFDNVGVFTYSDEEDTASFELGGRLDAAVKAERRARLLDVQRDVSAELNAARVGETYDVLVDGLHPETDLLLSGRWAGQAPEIDGSVLINDGSAAAGDFVRCEVTEAHDYDLVGRVAS